MARYVTYSRERLAAYIAAFKATGSERKTFGQIADETVTEVEIICQEGRLDAEIEAYERDPDKDNY